MRRATAAISRRHGMTDADAEDFTAWTLLRLVENDYAVLRQFRGESSLRTYLVVVLTTLHHEYRVRCWGRWRPSAAARRAGPIAVRLETLVYRDGYPLRQAINVVRLGGETDRTERQLATLFASLPRRLARGESELTGEVPDERDTLSAEWRVASTETSEEEQRTRLAIASALATLPAEDRLIVCMRFWEGMTVAEIARTLGLPQKPLYRRLASALRAVRRALEAAGVSHQPTHAPLDRAA
jgi:RNA polymerase sigma factor for flagellar operon FliA